MERGVNKIYRYLAGGIFLLAVVITIAAMVILLRAEAASEKTAERVTPTPSITPTDLPPTSTFTPSPSPTVYLTPTWTPFPTVDFAAIATSAAQPIVDSGSSFLRSESPYTFNGSTRRTRIVTYTVQRGDTINSITERFGISLHTLVWSNNSFYVNALSIGFKFTILPMDGATYRVQEPITIAELAAKYLVDPYVIIDSDYNQLKDAVPENLLPVGLEVVIPGGIGSREPLYYEPPNSAYISDATGNFGATNIYQGSAVFGEGQPGSCGKQPIYGGSLPSVKPVYGYVLTNDFRAEHGGVDLAGQYGEAVMAVGDGTVIFNGWSTWGYGYAVVIAHGSVMSLYAHLTGDVVWCGQQVKAGQYIGNLGSSGNSSGPHVHFEIRSSTGARLNPHDYLGL